VKVLLVSRNPAARRWMRRALEPSWEVVEAGDGKEAVDAAARGRIDVVVGEEIVVPYGAFGMTRDLKILENAPRVVLLLERALDVWLARWSGADAWLLQPVDPVALRDAVRAPESVPPISEDAGADEPPRAHAVAGTPYTEAIERT
jgi:DNA-binding response OmpR family regulator